MIKDHAKREVIRLYSSEYLRISGGLENHNDAAGALPFYNWLMKTYPEVVDLAPLVISTKLLKLGFALHNAW